MAECPHAETLTLTITLSSADLAAGWGGDIDSAGESVRATLREIIGDDGMPYVPTVTVQPSRDHGPQQAWVAVGLPVLVALHDDGTVALTVDAAEIGDGIDESREDMMPPPSDGQVARILAGLSAGPTVTVVNLPDAPEPTAP